jgi:hypothetical protein
MAITFLTIDFLLKVIRWQLYYDVSSPGEGFKSASSVVGKDRW